MLVVWVAFKMMSSQATLFETFLLEWLTLYALIESVTETSQLFGGDLFSSTGVGCKHKYILINEKIWNVYFTIEF